jgi:hypothetical protein
MIRIFVAAALLAFPQIAEAAIAPSPCLSRADAADLSLYVLPSIIPVVVDRCRVSLTAESWLVSEAPDYAQRLASQREAHWSGARRAMVVMAGKRPPKEIKDASLRSLTDDMLLAMLPATIDQATCQTIEDFGRLLAPLPAQNLGELTALLAEIGSRRGNSNGPKICPATQ